MSYAGFAHGMRTRALRAFCSWLVWAALACSEPNESSSELPLGSASAGASAGGSLQAGAAATLAGSGGAALGSGGSAAAAGAAISAFGGSAGISAFGGSAGSGGSAGVSAGSGGAAVVEPVPDALFDAAWAIFKPRCGMCHGDSAERFGGQDREKAFQAALIYKEEIERRISLSRPSRDAMPPRGALSASELATIKAWLAEQ
jgi:mono/diheme cytochrome c family protein